MVKIKELNHKELKEEALSLVWKVFSEYEAVNYPESGKQAFWNAIHSEKYLNMLKTYGAFYEEKLIGIIATRNEGSHVAMFFVDGEYHKKGIGRSLWNAVLAENISPTITVHSSLLAVEIYKKLGFTQIGNIQENEGIQFIPMEYRMVINKNCPCSKKRCSRKCNECRAYHMDSKRLRPCER